MATRKEIREALEASGGIMLNISALSRCLGWNPNKTREFVFDLPCITRGKDKDFFISDIARKLEKQQRLIK
jgi:hypothetical protein